MEKSTVQENCFPRLENCITKVHGEMINERVTELVSSTTNFPTPDYGSTINHMEKEFSITGIIPFTTGNFCLENFTDSASNILSHVVLIVHPLPKIKLITKEHGKWGNDMVWESVMNTV